MKPCEICESDRSLIRSGRCLPCWDLERGRDHLLRANPKAAKKWLLAQLAQIQANDKENDQ